MRTGVLIVLIVLSLVGLALVASGIGAGWQLMVIGLLLIAGVLFERSPYHRKPSEKTRLQATDEVFQDPVSGKTTRVMYDPKTGERYYHTEQEEQ